MNNSEQDSEKRRIPQGAQTIIPQLNEIGASTPYDFDGKNLTAYGGLLPVATMLEKLAELGAKAATSFVQEALLLGGCMPWPGRERGVNYSPRSPKGNRHMRRILINMPTLRSSTKETYSRMHLHRLVPRLGHN